jgi:hypothetical protein
MVLADGQNFHGVARIIRAQLAACLIRTNHFSNESKNQTQRNQIWQ